MRRRGSRRRTQRRDAARFHRTQSRSAASSSRDRGRSGAAGPRADRPGGFVQGRHRRSEEHTSELQSQSNLVCRLLLEKKKEQIRATLPRLPSTTVINRCWLTLHRHLPDAKRTGYELPHSVTRQPFRSTKLVLYYTATC